MPFSASADNVVLNGRTVVKFDSTDIGYVGEVMQKLTPIEQETTVATLTLGWDNETSWKYFQTRSADWTAAVDNREPTAIEIIGSYDKITLSAATLGVAPRVSIGLEKDMSGKAGSHISMKVKVPGLNETNAKAILSNAS